MVRGMNRAHGQGLRWEATRGAQNGRPSTEVRPEIERVGGPRGPHFDVDGRGACGECAVALRNDARDGASEFVRLGISELERLGDPAPRDIAEHRFERELVLELSLHEGHDSRAAFPVVPAIRVIQNNELSACKLRIVHHSVCLSSPSERGEARGSGDLFPMDLVAQGRCGERVYRADKFFALLGKMMNGHGCQPIALLLLGGGGAPHPDYLAGPTSSSLWTRQMELMQ